MPDEKMREEFETWLASRLGGRSAIVRVDGGYLHWETEVAWQSWQASRAALVIELPPKRLPQGSDAAHWANIRNNTISACSRAIEAAGARVKE